MYWKSIFVLVGIFAIGLASGFVLHRQLVEVRISKIKERRLASGLEQHFREIIKPEPGQSDEIAFYLNTYSEKLSKLGKEYSQQKLMLYDSLQILVEPQLNQTQIYRFRKALDAMKRKHIGGRRSFGEQQRPVRKDMEY